MARPISMLAVLACIAAGCVGAATAQIATPLIDRMTAIAQPCFAGKGDPKPVVETCVKALAAINGLRAQQTSVTPHEQNMYLANSVFVTTALSRLYTDMDKGQTARVCLSVELSWKSASQFNYAASPDFAVRLKALHESVAPAVAKCRAAMGAPAGAPPLPGAVPGPGAAASPAAVGPPAGGKPRAKTPKP
jgi:hypothetical protein